MFQTLGPGSPGRSRNLEGVRKAARGREKGEKSPDFSPPSTFSSNSRAPHGQDPKGSCHRGSLGNSGPGQLVSS